MTRKKESKKPMQAVEMETYTSQDSRAYSTATTERDSVKAPQQTNAAKMVESMDFEEMETVMWRKVRTTKE
jgi:hypothetical protein